METIWKVFSCLVALLFLELCNGLPLDLDHSYSDGHTQFLTGLIAILLTVCGVVCLAGCLCCQRRNGFKEFRDSPVVVSLASNLDHGHVNPIANGGEFTIFTPLSPPHQNNNVFLANTQYVLRAEEDYKNGDIDVRAWFGENEKDFPRAKLKYIQELKKGWFGRVVEGTAQGIEGDDTIRTTVVVRILDAGASSRQRVLYLHDANIYRCPPHPNVLKLLGRCLESIPLLLLQEYCSKGDLKMYLRSQQSVKEIFFSGDYPLRWCYELASAVKHLHYYNLIHPDLATRNCQLTEDMQLKLGDYGCATIDYPEDYYHGSENVPVRWCAPECVTYTPTTIQSKKVTTASNIWSLGVCLWEIYDCGTQPYKNLNDDEVISQVLGPPSVRLEKPISTSLYTDYIYRLMQLCWMSCESRPPILQIELMLADLMHVHANTNSANINDNLASLEDFDTRWDNLKPNAIVKTDNQIEIIEPETDLTNITVLNMNMEPNTSKKLSASLHNLAGSFDNLSHKVSGIDSWLDTTNDDIKGIHDIDETLALNSLGGNARLEFRLGPMDDIYIPRTTSSESETEDENWKKKIERGAYTEKVRQKSRSVADLMVLTHIDCSESDSETPLPSLDYRFKFRYNPKPNLENVSLTFNSEGNLLSVQDTFQEELKKLQEERRDSLLFVPEKESQSNLPSKQILEELNSPAAIEPQNQVFNVYNVVTYSPKYNLNRLIHYNSTEISNLPDIVLNTMEVDREIPKLSEIIENNIELMDYIIAKYEKDEDLIECVNTKVNYVNGAATDSGIATPDSLANFDTKDAKILLGDPIAKESSLSRGYSNCDINSPIKNEENHVQSNNFILENTQKNINGETDKNSINKKFVNSQDKQVIDLESSMKIEERNLKDKEECRNSMNMIYQMNQKSFKDSKEDSGSEDCHEKENDESYNKTVDEIDEKNCEKSENCLNNENLNMDYNSKSNFQLVEKEENNGNKEPKITNIQKEAHSKIDLEHEEINKQTENYKEEPLQTKTNYDIQTNCIRYEEKDTNQEELLKSKSNEEILVDHGIQNIERFQIENSLNEESLPESKKLEIQRKTDLNEERKIKQFEEQVETNEEKLPKIIKAVPTVSSIHNQENVTQIQQHEDRQEPPNLCEVKCNEEFRETKTNNERFEEQTTIRENENEETRHIEEILIKHKKNATEGENFIETTEENKQNAMENAKSDEKPVEIEDIDVTFIGNGNLENIEIDNCKIEKNVEKLECKVMQNVDLVVEKDMNEEILSKLPEDTIIIDSRIPSEIKTEENEEMYNIRNKEDEEISLEKEKNQIDSSYLLEDIDDIIKEAKVIVQEKKGSEKNAETSKSFDPKEVLADISLKSPPEHTETLFKVFEEENGSDAVTSLTINEAEDSSKVEDNKSNLNLSSIEENIENSNFSTQLQDKKRLIVKTQDFINNEILIYEDASPSKVKFDISQAQEEISPNSLTHSVFTSTPFHKRSAPESSVILGASDDYSIEYYSGFKTTTDETSSLEQQKVDLKFSLETWDNFLGRSFDEQHEFDNFAGNSLLFLENQTPEGEKDINAELKVEKIVNENYHPENSKTCNVNSTLRPNVTFEVNKDNDNSLELKADCLKIDSTFDLKTDATVDGKHEAMFDIKHDPTSNIKHDATFDVKHDVIFNLEREAKATIVKGNQTVDLSDINIEMEEEPPINEGYDNPGYWENEASGGWFLHPQTNSDELSGQIDLSQDDSYVGFSMDDEVMAALRNELLTKLPEAQRASSEQIEGDDYETTNKNEVFVRYNCYNTPLSPIPEESYSELLHSGQSTPHCTINTDLGDSNSDWSEAGMEPNSLIDDDTHSPHLLDSPQKNLANRHTPSQDSCCSNDTLFNLEELQPNEPHFEHFEGKNKEINTTFILKDESAISKEDDTETLVIKLNETNLSNLPDVSNKIKNDDLLTRSDNLGLNKITKDEEFVTQSEGGVYVRKEDDIRVEEEEVIVVTVENEKVDIYVEKTPEKMKSSDSENDSPINNDERNHNKQTVSHDLTDNEVVDSSLPTISENVNTVVDKISAIQSTIEENSSCLSDEPEMGQTVTQPVDNNLVIKIDSTNCKENDIPVRNEESSSSSETYLTVSDNAAFLQNVAPLNSPEDRSWKHIEASLSKCPEIPEDDETQNDSIHVIYGFVQEKEPADSNEDRTLSSNSEEEYAYENVQEMNLKNALASIKADYENTDNIYDCIEVEKKVEKVTYVTENITDRSYDNNCIEAPTYANQENKPEYVNTPHDYTNLKSNMYENVNYVEYIDLNSPAEIEYDMANSCGSIDEVYGPLTDIRFTGPTDSQMITTSFSESNDLGDEQDWDSGSDTRSSSSGEFIWKEGEHEASVKALHAAPQDMETARQEAEVCEDESSSGSEEGDGPEFVPSAWDMYATPTKSALRSPEKTVDRPGKKSRGVSFKKQKYHCVYEYPREPESPVIQTFDLWKDPKYALDWELDRDDPYLPGSSDIESINDITTSTTPLHHSNRLHRNLYQITNVPDFVGSSMLDEDFYISSSTKPFDMFGGPTSQFFPGRHYDWSELIKNNDNVTPDSGVEDITPGSLSDSCDYVKPSRQILALKTLAQLAVNKGANVKNTEIGGLRHTRNKLKLDLPPSPNAFTKTFTVDPIEDPIITRQVPTFTTFGKSRFVVQHVDTPADDQVNAKNVSFEALPYKPLTKRIYRDESFSHDKQQVESVRGEASLLDSADEDSGIESCILEKKNVPEIAE